MALVGRLFGDKNAGEVAAALGGSESHRGWRADLFDEIGIDYVYQSLDSA